MPQLVDATDRILADILSETHTIWHDQLERENYARWWQAQRRTGWGQQRLRRLALMDEGRVLASAKVYDLEAVVDGRPIGVCGLGAVFTQAAHRRRGCARTLIDAVLERAEVAGQSLALLFSEIGVDYYQRLGFIPVSASESVLRVADPPRRGAPATLVRVGDERDYDAIVEIGRRHPPVRFRLERDRSFLQYVLTRQRLRAGLAPSGTRELQFFIAEEGASAAAYVVLGVERNTWTLLECGDRDPTGARVGAMLQVLIAREPSQPRPTITGRLPPGWLPPQVTVLERVEAREQMMVRPLGGLSLLPPLTADDVLYWRNDLF
jgi:predicted N-acetyltransferase YhbS